MAAVRKHRSAAPICIGVHEIFAEKSDALESAGVRIVTTTAPHASNAIDVSELLATAMESLL